MLPLDCVLQFSPSDALYLVLRFIGCKNLGSQDVMQLNNEELKSGDQRQYPDL